MIQALLSIVECDAHQVHAHVHAHDRAHDHALSE